MSIITPHLVLFSLAGLGQAAIQAFNNDTATHRAPANATAFYKSPGQVLSIPLKHVERKGARTPSLAKRYFGSEVLGVYGAAYFAELSIGTGENPQTVDVLLDTGSFELWVNPDCAATTVGDLCSTFGRYDPKQSSTAKNLDKNFRIQYGQGNTSGDYYQDDVYISGAKVEDQQFGVSTQSSDVWFGILGLGRGQGNGIMDYPSVVDQLATQGYTDSKLFSLDLGGQPGPTAAITGEIVFGGVDTNKYAGNLAKVPIDPSDPHYVVTLTSLTLQTPNSKPATYDFHTSNTSTTTHANNNDDNNDLPVPVIVDSGTTLSLLPEPVVSALAAGFPGAVSDGNGGYTVPCALRDDADSRVHFGFRGDSDEDVMIMVKYSDFIWQADTDECVLGASYSPGIGLWILGDTFLRGTYVTFDQTNNGLYMAEYVRCGEESNLVPVPAGPDQAANIPGSCTAAPGAQKLPHGTHTAVPSVATKMDPEYSEYIPVPRTGTAGETPTAAGAKQARPAATSLGASTGKDEDCDEDGQPIALLSTAVQTVTNTVVRHVAYTAHGQPTTQLETVKMLSTISTTVLVNSNMPSATPAAQHATPVVTQKVKMYTTTAAERFMARPAGGTGGVHAPQGAAASSSAASSLRYFEKQGQLQSQAPSQSQQYQVLSHAMPSPSPPPPPSPQSMAVGAGVGAGVAYGGGMGWFNTSSSNNYNNNNNYGGNSGGNVNGNINSIGTAAGVAAPTRGPIGPVVVPAPAPTPTPAPALPMRPTATHSGFIIGTSGARPGRPVSGLEAWMAAVLVPALALVMQ